MEFLVRPTVLSKNIVLEGEITAGSGAEVMTVECDFGNELSMRGEWLIVDFDVNATSSIIVTLAQESVNGRDPDEAEMEPMACFADLVQEGSFHLIALPLDGPVVGTYLFNYLVG